MNLIKLESLRLWVSFAFVTNIVAMPSWAATISMRQGTAIVEIKNVTTVPSNPQTEDLVTVIAHITNQGTWAINGQCQFAVSFGGQVITSFSDQSWANPAPGNPAGPMFRFRPQIPGVYMALVTWKPTERYNSDVQESRSIQVTVSGPDTSKTNPNPFWEKKEAHAEAEHVREMQGLSKEEYEKRYRAEQKTADKPATMLHDSMHGLQKNAQKSQTPPQPEDDRAERNRQEQAQRAQAERDNQERIRKQQTEQEKAAMLRRQEEQATQDRREQARKAQAEQQEAERRPQAMGQSKQAEEERQRREVHERAQKEKEGQDRQWQAKLQREEAERQQRLEEGRKMNERIRLENEQRERERQVAREEQRRAQAEMARRQQEAIAQQQQREEMQRRQAQAQAAQQDAMRRSQGAAAAGMLLGMMAQGAQEREAREEAEREQAQREERNSTLTWRLRSYHPNIVHVRFYSLDRNVLWPDNEKVYILNDSEVHEMTIRGQPGERICYGAWVSGKPNVSWGTGKDQSHGPDQGNIYRIGSGTTPIIELRAPRPEELQADRPKDLAGQGSIPLGMLQPNAGSSPPAETSRSPVSPDDSVCYRIIEFPPGAEEQARKEGHSIDEFISILELKSRGATLARGRGKEGIYAVQKDERLYLIINNFPTSNLQTEEFRLVVCEGSEESELEKWRFTAKDMNSFHPGRWRSGDAVTEPIIRRTAEDQPRVIREGPVVSPTDPTGLNLMRSQ